MKKITFLFAMLLLVATNFAQTVLYTEDFESGGSAWTDQNLGDGVVSWTFGSGVVPGIGSGTNNDFPTNAAIFDDDSAGNGGQHDYRVLWHGPIDVSSYINVTLNYEYALNVLGSGTEELTIRLWDNANATWITIKTYSEDADPTSDLIDVSAALIANPGIDSSALYFGFGYDDIDGSYGWGAGIDNVTLTGVEYEETIFTHIASAANISSNYTVIDHPLLNGNSSAKIIVSHNWEETSTLNEKRVGVWYNGSNWTIFNEDVSNMIASTAYNIYIAGNGANVYTHISTAANQGTSMLYTVIDDATVNNDPNAIIVIENILVSPNNVYAEDSYGLFYDGTNWIIYNESLNNIPTNTAFNVVLAPTEVAVNTMQHEATAGNTSTYWTEIDDVLLNGKPDANFVFTHNWGASGNASNVIVENTQSIWFNDATNKWRIFNDDLTNMTIGAKFNILVKSSSAASVTNNELLSFNIFPNPAKEVLNIQSQDIISKVAIYNLIGQEVRVLTPNTSSISVNLNGLDSGMYIVKILSNDKEMSKKFIKK